MASPGPVGRLLQLGGLVFLVVVSLGLLPRALRDAHPEAARLASVAAWVVAPALGIGLLLLSALRLRARDRGRDAAPPHKGRAEGEGGGT